MSLIDQGYIYGAGHIREIDGEFRIAFDSLSDPEFSGYVQADDIWSEAELFEKMQNCFNKASHAPKNTDLQDEAEFFNYVLADLQQYKIKNGEELKAALSPYRRKMELPKLRLVQPD